MYITSVVRAKTPELRNKYRTPPEEGGGEEGMKSSLTSLSFSSLYLPLSPFFHPPASSAPFYPPPPRPGGFIHPWLINLKENWQYILYMYSISS
jgi:hypothetical protein